MKTREDYTRLVAAAFLLSLGMLVAFQIYLLREPERISSVLAADQAEHIASGQKLFATNCAACHGDQGLGSIGPALNSRKFLTSTDDGTIFSLIGSGVPGSAMPSWSQQHGGPFTDQQVNDLVVFIRHWEATATDRGKPQTTPDPAQGAVLFSTICFACHGINGEGTNIAPALNYRELLTTFDDNWFRQTIAQGRPSRGMPTWGKVLSPSQIDSIVAYIRTWQSSSPSVASVPPGADP
ncbi:MAG: c-type cytochrome, partial [Chloroflexota bacterium]|nr:c-type cytochrome [Chloroflexota bacterium]